jgi:hypothetical protein
MRLILLGVALLPYALLAGFDTWLHERARRVPRVEQLLHACAGVTLILFLIGAFAIIPALAIVALCVFAAIAACDEFGFHAHLAARERRVHFASYAALCVFVAAWQFSRSLS